MQNAARKRRPCSARNSCELSPTWLMPVFFASSAAPAAGGESAAAALVPSGTGFIGMSSIVSAPFAPGRRDSIGGGTRAQLECTEPNETISFPAKCAWRPLRPSSAACAAQLCDAALLEKNRLSMMRRTHQAVASIKGKRAVCAKAANDERQFRKSGIEQARDKTNNAFD